MFTSEGESTKAEALRAVQPYESRSGIDEWFRVLEMGTRIEERQLGTAESLRRSLVSDAVTAWSVFELRYYAREAPETPGEEVFSEAEMRVIESILQGGRLLSPSKRARTPLEDIGAWVVCTACIAGLRPWGLQPLPGSRMLWRAWMTVEACVRFDKALASADRGLRPAGTLLATPYPGPVPSASLDFKRSPLW